MNYYYYYYLGSKYRNLLSEAILKLQESGRLLELKEKWWKQKKGGGQCIDDAKKSSSSVTALKMDNVGGVFVVLIGGLALAFCLALCEFWFHAKTPHKACVSNIRFSHIFFCF